MGWAAAIKARVLGRSGWPAPLPTADFYFLGGVGDRIAVDGETGSVARPIVRMGPNLWTHDDRAVVVRYVTEDELALLASRRWRSIHYVIDDLLPAAGASAELPADYRARLTAFVATRLPRLLARDPVIVAPSAAIRAAFPQHEGLLLDPCCLALVDGGLPPTPWPQDGDGALDIAFLGTRSHAGSLALIGGIADRLASALPQARLHLLFGRHLPEALARRGSVVNRAALSWPDYRAWQRTARFHVALAPVQDTAFATARSITKVMDHAGVGAVGIYSARAPFAGVVEDGASGVVVGADTAEAWAAAIIALAQAPERAMAIAAGGQQLARLRGDPGRVRAFWMRQLAIDDAGGCAST